MNRKIICTLLSVLLLATFVLPCLSGCKAADDKNHYTVLQWLDKVEETFNLLYYSEQEPLIKSVKTSDAGFETVQIAAEWGIISPEDDLEFDGSLTKELAADTLVRAMNCVTPAAVDISDSKKVKALYLENVMSSVNEGIFALEAGKFDPKKQLSVAEADAAMLTAYYKWVNFSYGESFDRSVIKENVINLGGVTSENSAVVPAEYSVKYTGSRTFFDENGGYTDNTGKTITFPADHVPSGLAVDTVLAMPADDVVPMNYAVVVTEVKTNSDGSVTVSTRNAELQDVYEEIDIQQSGPLDFSEAIFYGPDGQRLTFDDYDEPVSMSNTYDDVETKSLGLSYGSAGAVEGKAEPLGLYRPGENKTAKTAKKLSKKVDLGNGLSFILYGSTTKNSGGIGFKIKGEVDLKGSSVKLSTELGFDETIKVENRIKTHWDWFKLKVDKLRLSVTDTKTETFGFDCSAVENFGKTINKVGDQNDNGKWDIGDWASEGHKLRKLYKYTQTVGQSFKDLSKKAKSATNKKLLDVVLPSTNLHFVIRAELTVEGSLKLTLTQNNMAGVELVKGKLRPIQEKTNSQNLDFSSKIELTFRIAFEFQLIGINVADVGFKAGIGAKTSSLIYSFDKATDTLMEVCGIEGAAVTPGMSVNASDNVQIAQTGLKIPIDDARTQRICLEVRVYPIATIFGCSSSSVAGKLFGSVELELLGENTPFLLVHYEINENGGGVVSECSISANENYGITTGDKLTLNMDEYAVAVSDDADTGLAVVTIPKNASIKDINIASDNPDVLEVENLLHKATAEVPSAKPELKIVFSGASKLIMKKLGTDINFTPLEKIGTWFYEDMSDGAKPQFALTGKKNGMANVTVTVNGEAVTVPIKVGTGDEPIVSYGALISTKGTFALAPGETAQTAFDFIPEGKTIADIVFTSANSAVASVSSGGLITAVGIGDTIITATLHGENKDFTTTFTVHVIA